jgi:hypothetical protein
VVGGGAGRAVATGGPERAGKRVSGGAGWLRWERWVVEVAGWDGWEEGVGEGAGGGEERTGKRVSGQGLEGGVNRQSVGFVLAIFTIKSID